MLTRRQLVHSAGAGFALSGAGITLLPTGAIAAPGQLNLPADLPQGVRDNATLEALPGKKPLIRLTYRPPNYETPLAYFRTAITPNDAFFVRYHLSNIPEVDAATWKLAIGGDGANGETALTLEELKQCRRRRLSPSTSARAIGADCSSRMFPEWNGVLGPWGAPAGKEHASRTSSKRSG